MASYRFNLLYVLELGIGRLNCLVNNLVSQLPRPGIVHYLINTMATKIPQREIPRYLPTTPHSRLIARQVDGCRSVPAQRHFIVRIC